MSKNHAGLIAKESEMCQV